MEETYRALIEKIIREYLHEHMNSKLDLFVTKEFCNERHNLYQKSQDDLAKKTDRLMYLIISLLIAMIGGMGGMIGLMIKIAQALNVR